jgi:CheY-like chemotaxis protein
MDVNMPEMDGLEASRRIVNAHRREERPVIVAVTADALQGDREKCIQAGMDDYLTKPIRVADIQGVITKWRTASGPKEKDPVHAPDKTGLDPLELALFERVHQLGIETDLGFMIELIDTYAPSFEKQIEALRQSCSREDVHNIHQAAHSLKGAGLNIGAVEFGALCRQIEEQAFQKDFEGVGKMIQTLHDEMQRVLHALQVVKKKLIDQLSSSER